MIRELTIRELVQSGTPIAARATGRRGGFTVAIRCGSKWQTLSSTRGTTRVFASLNSLAICLRNLGVAAFDVDATHYVPARVRPPRPDRAEALRGTRTKPHQPDLLR